MNLQYAIERLYQTGWLPAAERDVETLADGRRFPSIEAVQRHFAAAGLELDLKQNSTFNCCRATWAPIGQEPDPSHQSDESHGTVIGTSEHEAAVFALAQLRASRSRGQLMPA